MGKHNDAKVVKRLGRRFCVGEAWGSGRRSYIALIGKTHFLELSSLLHSIHIGRSMSVVEGIFSIVEQSCGDLGNVCTSSWTSI